MTILLILIAILALSVFIAEKTYNDYFFFMAGTLSFVSGAYLLIHVIAWSLASYDYNIFVTKRQAFIQTLNEARKNNNQIELASLTTKVSEWNQDLAERKYDRTTFLLKHYIDKRFESLHPIK